jgi:hypothetical protein
VFPNVLDTADGPERLEYAKWGALIGVVLGGLLGLFAYLG